MNTHATDADNIDARAVPPFPVTPVFPAPVTPGQVVSSATYGNVVRQALIDLWTDVQHVGTHASEVPATRQIIAGAGLAGGGTLAADVTLTANVRTVFGRTGDVVLTGADIAAGGGVPATRQVIAGTGLSGGGDLSGDRTLTVTPDATNQRVRVSAGGTLAGTRREINFVQGSNVTLAVADDAANNRVNVTITATGGGAAMPSNYWVNGALVGTRSTLNLIAGANTTIVGVDNSAGDRVDVTISSAAGGSAQTPWASDIDAAGFRLSNPGRITLMSGNAIRFEGGVTAPVWDTHGYLWQEVGFGLNHDSYQHKFNVGPVARTEAMRITLGANVGISRTNPRGKLDVSGTISFDGGANMGATDFLAAPWNSGGGLAIGWNRSNYAGEVSFVSIPGAGGTEDGGFGFYHGNGGALLRILKGGNVGIGTTSPLNRLNVVGDGIRIADTEANNPANCYTVARDSATGFLRLRGLQTSYSGYYFDVTNGGSPLNAMAIDNLGRVGIGTAGPVARLHVHGSTDNADVALFSGANPNQYLLIQSGPAYGHIAHFTGSGWGNVVLCRDGGNVGIGTAGPAVKLHVEVTADDTEGFRISRSGGAFMLRIKPHDVFNTGVSIVASNNSAAAVPMRIGASQLDLSATYINMVSGSIALPLLPSSNPGAGTKKLWYDPADGNRVKYAA